MRIMYGLLIAIEIILMGICSYKAMNKKGRLAKIVFIYEAVAAFCGIVFLVYIYVPGITITTLCKSLTLICFDWILILLMYYTQYYTDCIFSNRQRYAYCQCMESSDIYYNRD